MKKLIAAFLSAALALGLTACGGQAASTPSPDSGSEGADPFAGAPVIKVQFAENQPTASEWGKLCEQFCQDVAQATNNTVQVEFFGDEILGNEATVVGMVQMGTCEFTRVNLASLQDTVPDVGVLTLPYLYADGQECQKVLDSQVGQGILQKCKEAGFVGLSYSGGGDAALFRCFYSASPINTLADLKGKKIRCQEADVPIAMIKALGAVPTPMAYGEVFQALQTSVVDAAENDIDSYYLSGHYEAAPYFCFDNHQISPSMYIMSQKCYDSMTDAQRQAFLACLADLQQKLDQSTIDSIESDKEKLTKAGVTFIEVDTSEFRQAATAMYADYPEYQDYLAQIDQLLGK